MARAIEAPKWVTVLCSAEGGGGGLFLLGHQTDLRSSADSGRGVSFWHPLFHEEHWKHDRVPRATWNAGIISTAWRDSLLFIPWKVCLCVCTSVHALWSVHPGVVVHVFVHVRSCVCTRVCACVYAFVHLYVRVHVCVMFTCALIEGCHQFWSVSLVKVLRWWSDRNPECCSLHLSSPLRSPWRKFKL